MSLSKRPFVIGSKLIGLSDIKIMFHHILPNTWALIIVQATVSLAYAILLEASLSFLGVVQPPNPSLGSYLMMEDLSYNSHLGCHFFQDL